MFLRRWRTRRIAFVSMDGEELPQVTPSLLRRADDLCRRRLAHELRGGKRHANRSSDMRFAVSNRIEADARLAQSTPGAPEPRAFVEPEELPPEQRALYRAAARGYLAEFGASPARVVDLGWRTPLAALGVELVATIGIAAELDGGERELRKLIVGGRRGGRPMSDAVDERVALLRTEQWAPHNLRIVTVDVIEHRSSVTTPEVEPARAEAHEWMSARVATLLELASDARPRAGADCQGCAFVSGCSAHSG